MIRTLLPLFFLPVLASPALAQKKKFAQVPESIPYDIELEPKMEEPVFVVASKQGMRVLVSRDDGKSWTQTFLGSEEREDGGWHGSFATYGMACTGGVIGVFAGWGQPGLFVGSDDGVEWGRMYEKGQKMPSVWRAAGGQGVMITTAAPHQSMAIWRDGEWEMKSIRDLLKGKSHHLIVGYGDYEAGAFVVVGDGQHVFYSHDLGKTWSYSNIPSEAGEGQNTVTFGNGVFLVDYSTHVARSDDGGKTWELHPHGIKGRIGWHTLSFVNGEFWLSPCGKGRVRRSKDGIEWSDLPASVPTGSFVQAESRTIINVERDRRTILRSEDGTKWETVFEAPGDDPKDVTWSLTYAVAGKVNRVR